MAQQQEQRVPEDGSRDSAESATPRQQQQPQEGHGGHGSDSAMKQMRVWEQRRASNSGGKRRQGPN